MVQGKEKKEKHTYIYIYTDIGMHMLQYYRLYSTKI